MPWPNLTLADLEEARKLLPPPPDKWIYGIDFGEGPIKGPYGASVAQVIQFVMAGWVEMENGRLYWTPLGRNAVQNALLRTG